MRVTGLNKDGRHDVSGAAVEHQRDPRQLWRAKIDTVGTPHHIAWTNVDGDVKKELINALL